jgi:hypothetical protein
MLKKYALALCKNRKENKALNCLKNLIVDVVNKY